MGRVSEEDVKVLSRVLSSLPGASYFGAPAWRGVVRLDSWECRQMPATLEAYRDERVFLQWPVAVCDFDPTQVDGAEDYFD